MSASAILRLRSTVPLGLTATLLLLIASPGSGAGAVPTTVYAGGSSLFKTTDAGVTWTDVGTGIGRPVSAVGVDPTNPSTIYAGSVGGMFKTVDGGGHWNLITNGMSFVDRWNMTSAVSAIVIAPTNPMTLYAGTGGFGTGVFKSTNGGANWFAIDNGLTTGGSLDVRAMVMDPSNPNTLYVTGVTGMSTAKTTSAGAVWMPLGSSGLRAGFAAAIDPTQTATIYMAGPFGISKSTDGGINWSEMDNGIGDIFVLCLTLDPRVPATLYAGTGNPGTGGLFRSVNGGASWAMVAGMPPAVYTIVVDPANSSLIYAANDNGIYRSTDGGTTWQLSLAASVVRTLVMAPGPAVSVQTRLENLAAAVAALGPPSGPLNFGQANALLQKVGGALHGMNGKGETLACNHLRSLLNQITAFVTSGVLTEPQGGPLMLQVQSIMQAIPCS
jgi:hypothetical protein